MTGVRSGGVRRDVRRGLLRGSAWLRGNSERYLLEAAQADVARRLGRPPPAGRTGLVAGVWRGVYVPVFRFLPWQVRRVLIARMPGSHRRTWHVNPVRRDPAI